MSTQHNAIGRRAFLAGGALLALGGAARAQNYPSGPVKIIIGVGPGSSADVICRLIADHLSRIWGQQVIVFNQPGAGGAIGIRATGTAAPDGGTLYMSLASNYILLPQTQATLPFNVARDFVPIGFVGDQPLVITVAPALGVNTLPELIALAKKKPGELTAAAGLAGSALHLTAEWLKSAAGIDFTVIHYPAVPQGLADLIGGRIQMTIDSISGVAGAWRGGQVKVLAVAAAKRLPNFPDVPTVAETLPGFVASGWLALMAPPKTPEAIARKVSDDLRKVLAQPDVISRMQELGTYPVPMSPSELANFIAEQKRTWQPIIDKVGMVTPK
jgi:tripartite-type tricarboxylate transporter receptor subunit TctC